MTEYEPYGVRHFLRDADPEGASELRRRPVPLRDGSSLDKGEFADIDRFDLGGLLEYRTLVLRRSPLASRPPLADGSDPGIVYPEGSGTARGGFDLPRGGRVGVWVGGSFRGRVEVAIDGARVGVSEHVIDHVGQLTELGRVGLDPGPHQIELRYEEGGLEPGGGGAPFGIGPIVISPATAATPAVTYHEPAAAADLCERELDWVAALG